MHTGQEVGIGFHRVPLLESLKRITQAVLGFVPKESQGNICLCPAIVERLWL
jgi:hypothetical protein